MSPSTPRTLYCHCLRASANSQTDVKRFYSSSDGVKNIDHSSREPTSELGWDPREEEEEEDEYEHSIKQRILNASLNHVLTLGWSKDAITAGARDEGLSQAAHGMFDKGGVEIVHHFYRQCNKELVNYFISQEEQKPKAEGDDKQNIRPFLQDAIETRLKMIIPYHSIWKEAMALQALPQNAVGSWKNLTDLSDEINYHAGDRSVDFNWYCNRLGVAAVYKATEIYMLQDTSKDFEDTWIFLDNRMNDYDTLGVDKIKGCVEPLKAGILGMVELGGNVMGMNRRKR